MCAHTNCYEISTKWRHIVWKIATDFIIEFRHFENWISSFALNIVLKYVHMDMYRILQVNEINYVKINGTWGSFMPVGSINQKMLKKVLIVFIFVVELPIFTKVFIFHFVNFFCTVVMNAITWICSIRLDIYLNVLCFIWRRCFGLCSLRINWVKISIINKLIANFTRHNVQLCYVRT